MQEHQLSCDLPKQNYEETPDVVQKLMMELITYMNFTIIFMPCAETYGNYDHSRHKWSGMLGNVSAGEIDIPLTELTITNERYRAFDFTWPIFITSSQLYIRDPGMYARKWNAHLQVCLFYEDKWSLFNLTLIKMTAPVEHYIIFATNITIFSVKFGGFSGSAIPPFLIIKRKVEYRYK